MLTHELVPMPVSPAVRRDAFCALPYFFSTMRGTVGGDLSTPPRLSLALLFPHLRAPFDITKRSSSRYILFFLSTLFVLKVAEKVKPLDRSFCSGRNFGLLLQYAQWQTFFVLLNSRGQNTGSQNMQRILFFYSA